MAIFSTSNVLSNRRPSVDDTGTKLGRGTLSRRLTLPLDNPQRIGIAGRRKTQKTIDQFASPLFQLPYELRGEIWRYVLGGKCMAHDLGGWRMGDASNPWPPWEIPGNRKLRGLKSLSGLGWEPQCPKGFLSILMTCRQAYSEAIDVLYSSNLFYFRNPLTNWNLSSWRILPQRLAQIRIVVLDETIGNPSLTLAKSKRRQWQQLWTTLGQMTRLKVLYFNVDTLYPNIWTAELERELLTPLVGFRYVLEMHLIVRWVKPKESDSKWFENESGRDLTRGDEVDEADEEFRHSPAGDMRGWIIDKVQMLEGGNL
ncbi:hypothetical protein EG328_006071 [Venturia inaequalis]|uniref:DUF7730 domain-containing protein n=1 Tax=Venturia inaequalis TaxID=5025 RepID=A0A8H3UK69_VENIN|nr:hypothetical protein EG328_006071 [Venturia inaequalis]KAE9991463.1 hypothetical protein EG327_011625 [Venturia inaequalis]RDI81697.1 hypothetical protein Vi05172_g8334 [Venturia inaequalis]